MTERSAELLILGTGGPFLRPHRVSSGYVLYLDGAARILIDPGGGSFERAGRYGVDLSTIDGILYSHSHIDHTAGIPPFVFAMYMGGRKRAIRMAGPAGRDDQPGCAAFSDLLFGQRGAWAYMNSFEGFGIVSADLPSNVEAGGSAVVEAPEFPNLRIRSVAVPHGMMPAVAYRFDYRGVSLVFSGDIAHPHDAFTELARNADVLVHDFALPQRDVPHGNLHAKPLDVGKVAARSGCRKLVLSHFLPEIEDEIEAACDLVRRHYRGEIEVARDGERIAVGP